MPGDEVMPDDEVGLAVVGREINAVIPAESNLLEHFEKGAFVQRLAVHDHAVHVKNNRPKLFIHLSACGMRFVASLSIGISSHPWLSATTKRRPSFKQDASRSAVRRDAAGFPRNP